MGGGGDGAGTRSGGPATKASAIAPANSAVQPPNTKSTHCQSALYPDTGCISHPGSRMGREWAAARAHALANRTSARPRHQSFEGSRALAGGFRPASISVAMPMVRKAMARKARGHSAASSQS